MAERLVLPYPAVVCGHICLDVIPTLYDRQAGVDAILVPGKLVDIGPAMLSTGGAVSNTGLALHRLGVPARLMGKVGDDRFGETIVDIVRGHGAELADGMIVAAGEASSYTIVISPPGIDRIFLHCTGANDTFEAADVREELLREAGLFHFGYPPLMRRMWTDGGAELAALLAKAKAAGATVSLDLARPDPDAEAGRADWRAILSRALPSVDLFLPSFEEILFMLRREEFDALAASGGTTDLLPYATEALLLDLADELLGMGAAVVALKLGEYGLYMKTCDSAERLASAGRYAPRDAAAWTSRELYAPCFDVRVAGTTGAGDCTIAGLLTGWMLGLAPEEALLGAVGTGACNVERPDAVSGVPPWAAVRRRIAAGWAQRPPKPAGFRRTAAAGASVWRGPGDAGGGTFSEGEGV
ncbi:carbohydrate kinase family protein [Paenibacillus antri]|uniref:carbohydrate kinase family protein n=1 Tax=Paenibacillus antri TaxID=2582848 RepID=UPI001EE443ED|nr:carbohydrate kinase family protein [Paenibacillus antri]